MTEWNKTFDFKSKKLYYNRIQYNNPSERAVEVPIGFDFLAANVEESARVLEVGNVLSCYENTLSEEIGIISREIVDKFEKDIGIDNHDLMELNPPDKYNVILSISTVEHIGQEVDPTGGYGEHTHSRDREAPLKAIVKIYDLLAVNGKALITVPFGTLTDGRWYIQFSGQYLALLYNKYGIPKEAVSTSFLKLIDRDSGSQVNMLWEDSQGLEVSNCEYHHPLPAANAIAVIELSKVSNDFYLNLNVEPTPLFYNKPYGERIGAAQDKAELHQIQAELEQYKAQLHQTQANVEIISVHVPKTAGTTFSQILSDVYGIEAVFQDNLNVLDSQIYKPSDLPADIKVIHGHFHLDKYNGYFPDAKRVIWLRNPVVRLISNYFFWRTQEVGVPRNMDVLGILEFAEYPGMQNVVTNYIGKNQLSDFYFVGIMEFLESDLENLKTMMGWPELNIPIRNKNTFGNYEYKLREILDDNELIKKLAQSNSLDMELYQEALNLRAKRRNELGGFHQILQLCEKSQSQWHQTQTELEQSQSQLHQTQTELEQSQSQLHQTRGDLKRSQSQFHLSLEDLQQSQSQLHQTQEDLQQSQSQLHQLKGEFEQLSFQFDQMQVMWQQSQEQLHQLKGEFDRSRLTQATPSPTGEQSQQMQYKLLVWEAWYACQNRDLKQMAQYLRQSLKHTPFSRTETILNWLDNFANFSSEKGDNFDTNSLTNTLEWKELMRGMLAVKTASATH